MQGAYDGEKLIEVRTVKEKLILYRMQHITVFFVFNFILLIIGCLINNVNYLHIVIGLEILLLMIQSSALIYFMQDKFIVGEK